MSVQLWTVLIPLKPLGTAKSRLRGALPGVRHEDLVLSLASSTVAAVRECGLVRRTVVITNVALESVETVPDLHGDLNDAIREAARLVTGPVAVIPADLPALRAKELAEALALCEGRSFVPDAEGTGTVLLAALDGALDPHFGPGSALIHERSGAKRLAGDWPTLRRDVDTAADLAAVEALGWRHAGHGLRV
jgi:2-phospho-L-lactate guanylyltransferase